MYSDQNLMYFLTSLNCETNSKLTNFEKKNKIQPFDFKNHLSYHFQKISRYFISYEEA